MNDEQDKGAEHGEGEASHGGIRRRHDDNVATKAVFQASEKPVDQKPSWPRAALF